MVKTLCVLVLTVICAVKVGSNTVVPTVTPGTVPPNTRYQYALERTALVTCGQPFYPDNIYPIVFPPSEATKAMFDQFPNITLVKTAVQGHLDLFCSHVSNYSSCLKETLTSGNSAYDDQLLSLFVDGNTIPAALDKFCDNKDLVLSQFECTYQSLQSTTCNGGIIDILEAIITEMNSRSGVFGYTCKDIKPRIDCRIQKQLTPCNAQFASVMSDVIKGMLKNECEEGGYIEPRSKWTEMAPCLLDYVTEIEDKVYDTPMNTTEAMAQFLVDMMNSFCGYATNMVTCAFEKAKTSTYPGDITFRKVTNEQNLKIILEYGCSKVPLFAKHSTCVMTGLMTLTGSQTSCFMQNANKYTNDISAIFNTSTPDLDLLKDKICMLMNDFGTCMAPMFSDCNAELGDAFSRFVTYNVRTCQDPTYVIPTVSSASRALPILSTILSFLFMASVL